MIITKKWQIPFLLIVLTCIFILNISIGPVKIATNSWIDSLFHFNASTSSTDIILWKNRIPRTLTALLAGSALAISGLLLQVLFRNPLAGPSVLGISAGSGLGAAFYFLTSSGLSLGFFQLFGPITFSILGALLVTLILLGFISYFKDLTMVLIIGIMLSSLITASITLLQYSSDNESLRSFILWTMGDLTQVSLSNWGYLSIPCFILFGYMWKMGIQLNLYTIGDIDAKLAGINTKKLQWTIIIITSLLIGIITAYCGPIGFIGLVIPHLTRLLFSTSDISILIPRTALIGAIFLTFSDFISKLPASAILPINSVTSFLCIPFLIWFLFKNQYRFK